MLPQKQELDMFYKMNRVERMERILELYRESLVKLEDGRADLPDKMPGLFDFNQWNTNKPGTSVFIPVTDITEEYLNLLTLYCSHSYGFTIIDDLTGKPAGVEKWIKIGRFIEFKSVIKCLNGAKICLDFFSMFSMYAPTTINKTPKMPIIEGISFITK